MGITCSELNSVWDLSKSISRERQRVEDLRLMATRTTQILDGMPHTKPMTFKVERVAVMIADSENFLSALGEQLIDAKFNLLMKIQSFKLPELQERVLSYHYVSCLRMKEVAQLMNYTKEYISLLHCRGLKALGLNVEEMNKLKKRNHYPIVFPHFSPD